MKAQTVKNAVIVPVGAKGGFVVKRPPTGRRPRRAARGGGRVLSDLHARAARHHRHHLGRRGRTAARRRAPRRGRPLPRRRRRQGHRTFSDIANAISAEYGFWLGDAFASGGSAGYDHKELGITARGAWESVKRHFRELGMDVERTDFTVIGIGDMSGDVFGNGMLLSRHIRLLGAFDHRHVFLDPDPDPEASFAERERLFRLPGSSWADYDPALISPGGGVSRARPRRSSSHPRCARARRRGRLR